MIRDAIAKLLAKRDLSEVEAAAVMAQIMDGRASQVQVAAYLVALRCKGETVPEMVGSARCMREHALQVPLACEDAVDLCGTGGDGKETFNVSTTCAFAAAGAGVSVAKHGNRAASSRCGSADLLEALGVAIDLNGVQVARCIEEVGMGFMFAPLFHPAMKNVAPVRRELGVRTIFNVLGPLANPAGVRRQMVGVFEPGLVHDMADALRALGGQGAVVVFGRPGYDEATTCGVNELAILRGGEVSSLTLDPEALGFDRADPNALRGGTPDENASMALRILDGEPGPGRDTVLLNCALALLAAGAVDNVPDGVAAARDSIDSRKARRVLDELVRFSQSLAGERS